MQAVTITLPDVLFAELKTAAAEAREMTFGPERWAAEAIESALAARRARRVRLPITPADALARRPVELPEELEE